MMAYLFWELYSQWDTTKPFTVSFFYYPYIYLLGNLLYRFIQTLSIRTYSSCILRSLAGNKTFRMNSAHTYQPLSFAVKSIQGWLSYFPWEQIGFLVLCFVIKIVLSDFCLFVLLFLTQTNLGDCFQKRRKKICLELKSKHVPLCLWHLLWLFWDNLTLDFLALGV